MSDEQTIMGLSLERWAAIWPEGTKKLGREPSTVADLLKIKQCAASDRSAPIADIERKLCAMFKGLFQ